VHLTCVGTLPYELLTTSDVDSVQARPLGKLSHWFLFVGERGLEGDDVEVRDHLEVAHVKRDHIEAEMEGCGSDDEVWKVDADPLAHLLAVDTPGQPRHFQRERMHSHRLEEFFDEGFPTLAVGVCPGSIDTVRQFYGSHSRERSGGLSTHGLDPLQDFPHTVPAPFACDQDAGVEDYSHAGGFHGLRLLMISSRSAAKSGSIRGS